MSAQTPQLSKLLVIQTGGTISRIGSESLRHLDNSYIQTFLGQSRLDFDVEVANVCAKFSEEITSEDIARVRQIIRTSSIDKILITCGTDRMKELAQEIKRMKLGKTILFTGSMVPFKHPRSDARYNLASSFTYLQMLNKKGVWICMHGALFDPNRVVKDVEHKHFYIPK